MPGDILPLPLVAREHLGEPSDDTVDDCVHLDRTIEQPRHRGNPTIADTARDDVIEHRKVGIDVERESVPRPPPRHSHADRRDLLVADPHAGVAGRPVGRDPEVGTNRDEHGFELADVGDDVALACAPLLEGDDRVADELTGTVVCHVAAAISLDELGSHRGRIAEHVLDLRARPERVHVRMLLEQQVVGIGVLVDRTLQRFRFRVGHEPEPTGSHASSASQSCVSSSTRKAFRNDAA